jgi:beta-mannosidase
MIRARLLIAFVFLSTVSVWGQDANPVGNMSLDGVWKYQPIAKTTLKTDGQIAEDKSNLPPAGTMPVPSNWHLHGLPNFNGRVKFTREFNFARPLAATERAFLEFRGVDYFAEISLNGNPVGKHEGYFQSFEFDVTPFLKPGRNELTVTVDAPLEEPGTVWPDHKRMIKGLYSDWDCKPGSISLKNGQDGTTAGIWNSVELEVRNQAWLGTVKIQPFLFQRGLATDKPEDVGLDAEIYISAEVLAASPGRYEVTAEIGDSTASSLVDLRAPSAMATLVVPMAKPHLWWTWDLGEPYLYNCNLSVKAKGKEVYKREVRFGVRSMELDEKTGEWRLNGVRFFIRGTNIVPDLWLAQYTPERIAQDIKLLKDAHANGVRICVHVDRQELYDALDRAGIVAWQDFPLNWDYTHASEFMQEAGRQLRDMIDQFYNHPSIITWVCQNESTAYNVKVLDPFLARVGAQEDSSRPVRPVAADSEHLYLGWYGGDYHSYDATNSGPIVSELGAQALPSVEEVKAMAGDAWPPDWDKLAYHDFQYEQTFHVANVPMGSNWDEFVQNSQRYQADTLKFAIEHFRRVKYQKIGSIFQFQFMDCWPGITWSVVSAGRKPKLGYYAVQRAFQPVLIGADLDRTIWSEGKNIHNLSATGLGASLDIWVVNDEHRAITGATYEGHLRGQGKDVPVCASPKPVDIGPDSVMSLPGLTCAPPADVPPGSYDVVLTLKQGDQTLSENTYAVTVVD